MKTRSQATTFSVKEVEAAKALLQLKKACTAKPSANTWPSGRPRRSTARYVNYTETD
jgi:hypothetical protein